jgi:hypothetical protein
MHRTLGQHGRKGRGIDPLGGAMGWQARHLAIHRQQAADLAARVRQGHGHWVVTIYPEATALLPVSAGAMGRREALLLEALARRHDRP